MERIAEYQFDFKTLDSWFKGKLSELIISYIQQNKKLVNNVDVFLNIYASESIFEFARECARDHWSEPEMLVSQVPRYHFKKLLDILGERKCENIYEEMRDKCIIDYYITDYIDKGVDVVHSIRRFIDLNRDRTEAKSIIARYLREINEDEIKEWRKGIYRLEFIEKLSDEQKKFFAKYLIFDYVAIMKDEEICIIKVKLPTMERQIPHFSDRENEAIKEAKNVGINIILANVNFGPSWNFTVKLTKLEDTEIIAEYQIDFRKLGNWFKGKLSEFIVCELIRRKYTSNMDFFRDIRSSKSIWRWIPYQTFYWFQDSIDQGKLQRLPCDFSSQRYLKNLPASEEFCEKLLGILGAHDLGLPVPEEFCENLLNILVKRHLALIERYPEVVIGRYHREIQTLNIDEIKEVFSLYERKISENLYNQLKSHEFFGKMSIEQMKFFAKYFFASHPPFDYVAITKDNEVCIIEVKSTTMGRQNPNFSDREKEAIKEAKNVGISVIVATVNYGPSWNLSVKLIKL